MNLIEAELALARCDRQGQIFSFVRTACVHLPVVASKAYAITTIHIIGSAACT